MAALSWVPNPFMQDPNAGLLGVRGSIMPPVPGVPVGAGYNDPLRQGAAIPDPWDAFMSGQFGPTARDKASPDYAHGGTTGMTPASPAQQGLLGPAPSTGTGAGPAALFPSNILGDTMGTGGTQPLAAHGAGLPDAPEGQTFHYDDSGSKAADAASTTPQRTAQTSGGLLDSIVGGTKTAWHYLNGEPAFGGTQDPEGPHRATRLEVLGQALGGMAQGLLSTHGVNGYGNGDTGWGMMGLGGASSIQQARAADDQAKEQEAKMQARKMAGLLQAAQIKAAMVKAGAPVKVGEGESLVDPVTHQAVYQGKQKPMSLGAGDALVDPTTGQPIAQRAPNPMAVNGSIVDPSTGKVIASVAPQATTPDMAFIQSLPPGQQQAALQKFAQAHIAEMTKPVATQVSLSPTLINQKGETKYAETVGEGAGKELIAYHDEAAKARDSIANAQLLRTLQPMTQTGATQDQLDSLRRLGAGLGVGNTDKLAARELFGAISKKAVLDQMGGKLGAGVSNADVGFAQSITANTGNEPQANMALIDIQQRLAERRAQVADMAEQFAQQNRDNGGLYGKNPQGQSWNEFISGWAKQNPVFDDNFRRQLTGQFKAGKADAWKDDY